MKEKKNEKKKLLAFFSGISYLGMPTEVYFYGINYTYIVLGLALAGVACKYLFLPVLCEMELSSTYKVW